MNKVLPEELTYKYARGFNDLFGWNTKPDFYEPFLQVRYFMTVAFSGEMLFQLMDYYMLSIDDMATLSGLKHSHFKKLLKLKGDIHSDYIRNLGFATCILILGTEKYCSADEFLPWFKWYLQDNNIKPPFDADIYVEFIDEHF
jgi:hypothetical protein